MPLELWKVGLTITHPNSYTCIIRNFHNIINLFPYVWSILLVRLGLFCYHMFLDSILQPSQRMYFLFILFRSITRDVNGLDLDRILKYPTSPLIISRSENLIQWIEGEPLNLIQVRSDWTRFKFDPIQNNSFHHIIILYNFSIFCPSINQLICRILNI